MKKSVIFVLFFKVLILGDCLAVAQVKTFSINSLDSLMQVKPKPIVVLLSTDWCKYCMIQKSQLDKNEVFNQQSDKFYFTIFNAETSEDITFNNKLFKTRENPLKSSKNIHILAQSLNQSQQVNFPTWVILNEKYEVIFKENGMLSPKEISTIVKEL